MEKNSPITVLAIWLGIIASLFIISGQVLTFFVNMNILKEQRVNKTLEKVTT
jgi:hypothetical protein